MNTIELKRELIDRISGIDDAEFLNAIKTILDYKKNESFIELTAEQEKELLIARDEGKKGNFVSHTEMDKKVQEWLKQEK